MMEETPQSGVSLNEVRQASVQTARACPDLRSRQRTGLDRSKIDAWDDGRTIADMSGLERPSLRKKEDRDIPISGDAPQMDKEDRRMYLFGAMGAALTIALIFIGAAAIVILLMLFFWGAL